MAPGAATPGVGGWNSAAASSSIVESGNGPGSSGALSSGAAETGSSWLVSWIGADPRSFAGSARFASASRPPFCSAAKASDCGTDASGAGAFSRWAQDVSPRLSSALANQQARRRVGLMLNTPGTQRNRHKIIRAGRVDPFLAPRPHKRRGPTQSYNRQIRLKTSSKREPWDGLAVMAPAPTAVEIGGPVSPNGVGKRRPTRPQIPSILKDTPSSAELALPLREPMMRSSVAAQSA